MPVLDLQSLRTHQSLPLQVKIKSSPAPLDVMRHASPPLMSQKKQFFCRHFSGNNVTSFANAPAAKIV